MSNHLEEAPEDNSITLEQLYVDPYPLYKKLRAEKPVVRVKATNRTFITRAADTKKVKMTPEIFSSDDPNTPMKRAFQAHTLMRKDGEEHRCERQAMAPAFDPLVIRDEWMPLYQSIAEDYVSKLPRGETVDLFSALAAPYAARGLAHLLGIEQADDDEMQRWSQVLIDGAGNFGWLDKPFALCDQAHLEMDAMMEQRAAELRAAPNSSALSAMVNAENPIPWTQILANIKIAIGGGINEPRDALCTILFGLLENPEQLEAVKTNQDWGRAFEEGVRWVAPIQVSSRHVVEDTEIGGYRIPKGDTVMTIQASANRDESIYEDGELFQVYRDKKPHQAFGNGPHFCMGTHVARRAIADIMLPLLFERFPNMTLPSAVAVQWHGFGFRGPLNLPVKLA